MELPKHRSSSSTTDIPSNRRRRSQSRSKTRCNTNIKKVSRRSSRSPSITALNVEDTSEPSQSGNMVARSKSLSSSATQRNGGYRSLTEKSENNIRKRGRPRRNHELLNSKDLGKSTESGSADGAVLSLFGNRDDNVHPNNSDPDKEVSRNSNTEVHRIGKNHVPKKVERNRYSRRLQNKSSTSCVTIEPRASSSRSRIRTASVNRTNNLDSESVTSADDSDVSYVLQDRFKQDKRKKAHMTKRTPLKKKLVSSPSQETSTRISHQKKTSQLKSPAYNPSFVANKSSNKSQSPSLGNKNQQPESIQTPNPSPPTSLEPSLMATSSATTVRCNVGVTLSENGGINICFDPSDVYRIFQAQCAPILQRVAVEISSANATNSSGIQLQQPQGVALHQNLSGAQAQVEMKTRTDTMLLSQNLGGEHSNLLQEGSKHEELESQLEDRNSTGLDEEHSSIAETLPLHVDSENDGIPDDLSENQYFSTYENEINDKKSVCEEAYGSEDEEESTKSEDRGESSESEDEEESAKSEDRRESSESENEEESSESENEEESSKTEDKGESSKTDDMEEFIGPGSCQIC